jgi:hypothetical protein
LDDGSRLVRQAHDLYGSELFATQFLQLHHLTTNHADDFAVFIEFVVYGRETRADADIAKVLTTDEARRIARNIAKLPTLRGKS